MGIDLTILIVTQYDNQQGYAHSMLEWGRAGNIIYFEKIFTLPLFKLNSYLADTPNEYHKGGSYYGHTYENPYGSKISYIKIENFVNQAMLIKDLNYQQQGIVEFLKHLNGDDILALYFH